MSDKIRHITSQKGLQVPNHRQQIASILNRLNIPVDSCIMAQLRTIRNPDDASVRKVLSAYTPRVPDDLTQVTKWITESQAGKSPVIAQSPHKPKQIGVYLVDPDTQEKWESHDDSTDSIYVALLATKDVFNGDETEWKRAFSIGTWYLKVYSHVHSELLQLIEKGKSIKLGEATDLLRKAMNCLEPKPNFNFSRFGKKEQKLEWYHIKAFEQAILDEILIPNRFFAFHIGVNTPVTSGVIFDNSEFSMSPCGRRVQILKTITTSGECIGSLARPRHIVESSVFQEMRSKANGAAFKNLQVYEREGTSHEYFSFTEHPEIMQPWVGIHFCASSRDIDEARQEIDRIEMTSMSDGLAATEVKIGRRIVEGMLSDLMATTRVITKKDSYLLNNTKNGPPQDRITAMHAISLLRSKCISIAQSSFPAVPFFDYVRAVFIPSLYSRLPSHQQIVAVELAKLFGPSLDKKLSTKQDGKIEDIHTDIWLRWFDKNLKGPEKALDAKAMREFNERLRQAAPNVLQKHFHMSFDHIDPSWRDMEVDFKEWSNPLSKR